jgi:hypothetical protein
VVIKRKLIDRERLAGAIIFISLFVILLSMVGIQLLDVKVSNIELVDRGLYTIITDNGPTNISPNDILRIERTHTEAAITGIPVEKDKIFTTKGFIYFSSLDPFYKTGHQLINSVDFVGNPVWIRENNSETTGAEQTQNQLQNANLKAIQPFSYAIGTPSKLTYRVFSVLLIQYLALAIGGIAIFILIFPLRLEMPTPARPFVQQDSEYCPSEEHIGAVAK